MGLLEICRIISGLAWACVVVFMARGVWDLVRGKGRHGDPARLQCLGVGVLMICFVCRWWLIPDSEPAFAALYLCSAIWAGYTIVAAVGYGRGPRV